jgi:hypothetical protein
MQVGDSDVSKTKSSFLRAFARHRLARARLEHIEQKGAKAQAVETAEKHGDGGAS